jgi:hypothetical protein
MQILAGTCIYKCCWFKRPHSNKVDLKSTVLYVKYLLTAGTETSMKILPHVRSSMSFCTLLIFSYLFPIRGHNLINVYFRITFL